MKHYSNKVIHKNGEFQNQGLTKYMPAFERALKSNGSNGYLVGYKLSVADIGLLEVILTVDELLGNDQLNDYSEIKVNIIF